MTLMMMVVDSIKLQACLATGLAHRQCNDDHLLDEGLNVGLNSGEAVFEGLLNAIHLMSQHLADASA